MRTTFITCFFVSCISIINVRSQQLEWVKQSNGTDYSLASAIAVDNSGIYVIGDFWENISFDNDTVYVGNGGSENGYIAKTDFDGDLIWLKNLTTSTLHCEDVVADGDHIYITGRFINEMELNGQTYEPEGAGYNGFVAKLNQNGETIWVSTVGYNGSRCELYGIAVDQDKNVFVTGTFRDYLEVGNTELEDPNGESSILVVKFDSLGEPEWAKHGYDQQNGSPDNIGYGIAVAPNGDVYVTGITAAGELKFGSTVKENLGTRDAFLMKFSGSGSLDWLNLYGKTSMAAEGISVKAVSNSSIYFGGNFTVGDFDLGNGHSVYNAQADNFFIAEVNSSGTAQWIEFGGDVPGDKYLTDCEIDDENSVYVSTHFRNEIEIGSNVDSTDGAIHGLMIKWDENHNVDWFEKIGECPSYSTANSLAIRGSWEAYVAGEFRNELGFPNDTLTTTDSRIQSHIVAYSSGLYPMNLEELNSTVDREFEVYPNPTSGKVWIQSSQESEILEVKLYNILGNIIELSVIQNETRLQFNAPETAGTYLLTASFADGTAVSRYIIVY